MLKTKLGLLVAPLLLASSSVCHAQYRDHDRYNNGIRQGGRGGQYYHQDYNRGYDDRNYHQGGIGPGKGALIGGAGGAVLGGLLGGGLKGSLIGGAAGAGIGAIAGKEHQNNVRNRDGYYGR